MSWPLWVLVCIAAAPFALALVYWGFMLAIAAFISFFGFFYCLFNRKNLWSEANSMFNSGGSDSWVACMAVPLQCARSIRLMSIPRYLRDVFGRPVS